MTQPRFEKLNASLQTSDLDAVILNPGPTLTYLTGLHFHLMERPVVFLFAKDQDPAIVLPELELQKVPALLGNSAELREILTNLIFNAVDAMPAGGDVRITAQEVAGRVRLTVADTGQGIPADLLPRIFDPWFSTKPVGRGSGLGLGIARDVVTRFGGTIDLASAPGQGTTVTLEIPFGK